MKKINEKKTVIYIVILIILLTVGLFFKYKNTSAPTLTNPSGEVFVLEEISIKSKGIKEKNFSGKISVIEGNSKLALEAQAYVDNAVSEFKKQADVDVPAMRAQFGDDVASSQYEIIIDAKYIFSEKTESVAILTYEYTGGAHGNNSYNVISASKTNGEILDLSSVIKTEKQKSFTDLVKKDLLSWRPFESAETVVFTEEVSGLTFDSFTNWSLDDKNLILYFSQYDIGPGVLGPVAYPISLEKVKDMLK
jgi:hypothetical protein